MGTGNSLSNTEEAIMLAIFKKNEDVERKRQIMFSMQCAQVLRDAVHGLGWSAVESPEFSPYAGHIRAADTIGNAIFKGMHKSKNFGESDEIFGGESALEKDFAESLLASDLGEHNQLRNALASKPTYTDGLNLMGRLLNHVMQSVHTERMKRVRSRHH